LPSLGGVNPRPEIVLPPGFSLRIDYDPAASPASLLITAFRDETPVGQAHVDPREVGLRLRLELADEDGAGSAPEPRLRLTPSRALRAIEMGTVQQPVAPREVATPAAESPVLASPEARAEAPAPVTARIAAFAESPVERHAALEALHELAREGALGASVSHAADDSQRPLNALVWLENGSALVLPSREPKPEESSLSPFHRALRALSGAAELLASPLRLRGVDEGWASWRAGWRSAPHAGGASES